MKEKKSCITATLKLYLDNLNVQLILFQAVVEFICVHNMLRRDIKWDKNFNTKK